MDGEIAIELPHLLAIGAHPDDVVLGAGGVLAKLAAAGHIVTLLCMTSGEMGGSAAAREDEEIEASRRIGASVIFGRLQDGSVDQRAAIRVISDYVRQRRTVIVFAPDPNDTHQDHVNVGKAATVACRAVDNLFFYEGPSTVAFHPNSVIDISDVWETKEHALNAYISQLRARNLMSWVRSVADFRAWPRHVGSRCESFRVMQAELSILGFAQSAASTSAHILAREA